MRNCIVCNDEIFESMGSVVSSEIFKIPTGYMREICGKCVLTYCMYTDFGQKQHVNHFNKVNKLLSPVCIDVS
jgi:hypothetical protein